MQDFLRRHWRKAALSVVGFLVLGYVGLGMFIGHEVRGAVADAMERFPGDPVLALISVATDEEAGLSERNRAIWALGQLGAPEALPVLDDMVTGEPCDHGKLICQKEVASAIKGCSGGVNAGRIIWGHGDLAELGN